MEPPSERWDVTAELNLKLTIDYGDGHEAVFEGMDASIALARAAMEQGVDLEALVKAAANITMERIKNGFIKQVQDELYWNKYKP